MYKVFFSASQQAANKYHCGKMTEKEYCEGLVNLILTKLPKKLVGYCKHSLSYDKRPQYAKTVEADVYVTIHTNAASGKARGMEIGTSGSKQDAPFAQALYNALEPLTPANDRGLKKYSFYEATAPLMPSCYIELSFHDNHEDEQFLLNNRNAIADGIVKGLCDYFKINEAPKEPAKGVYTLNLSELKHEYSEVHIIL